MVSRNIKLFVKKGELESVENYEDALRDEKNIWVTHHRLETHFADGTKRPYNAILTPKELKKLGMYYNRPSSELILLTRGEHNKIHREGLIYDEERKRRISEGMKRKWSERHEQIQQRTV